MIKNLLCTFTVVVTSLSVNAQNIGIGTSSPTTPLEIANPTNLPTTLLIQSGNTQYANGIVVNPSTHATSRRSALWLDDWGVLQDASGTGTKDFGIYQGSAAAWRLFVNTSGNVGIGNVSPGYKLDVSGDARATGDVLAGSHFISTSGDPYFRTNTNDKHIVLSGGSGWTSTGATMVMRGVDATNNPHGIEIYTGGAERLRILSGGNVGIGATSPAYKLHVAGDIYSTGNNIINNGSPTLFLQDTDEYSGMIHMNANQMYFLSGSGANSLSWAQNGSYWPLYINLTNDDLVFGGRALFMEGNVGIGEASPSRKLHVNGNTYMFRNNPAIDNGAYTNTHIELVTNDNSFPGIGFHRAGTDAFALYYAGGYPPNIRYRDASGNDARVVTNRTNVFFQQNATSNGVFDQAMINVNSGFCFLTYQAGDYRGGGEACQIYSDGTNWVLRAQKGSGSGIYCGANCISY